MLIESGLSPLRLQRWMGHHSPAFTLEARGHDVIRREEEVLTQAFGERFARYCGATPRWFPRWSNFHEPESWSINPPRFRAGLLDVMWFLWAFLIWEILEESGALQWIRGL